MFGSEILDVALGLAFVFLLVSLMATTVREAVEAILKERAAFLERGIREMLADTKGNGMARTFYEHPLIYSLFQGRFEYKEKRFMGRGLPTYIPALNFANTIIDLVVRGPVPEQFAASQVAPDFSVATLRANVSRLQNPRLVRAVLTAIDHAEGDMNKVRENLQAWFDSSMDRVSGWYKRRTHLWLFIIGFVLAAFLNVDAIRIANRLWRDKPLRDAIATRAEAVARDTGYQRMLAGADSASTQADIGRLSAELNSLRLPIGWSDSALAVAKASPTRGAKPFLEFWLAVLIGFVPTALAVTLGAPFWFDALNKIMVIRSTVKPHEKSPEESSEDRQKDTKPTTIVTTPSASGATRASSSRAALLINAGAGLAATAASVDSDSVPNEWAIGEPAEGIL